MEKQFNSFHLAIQLIGIILRRFLLLGKRQEFRRELCRRAFWRTDRGNRSRADYLVGMV